MLHPTVKQLRTFEFGSLWTFIFFFVTPKKSLHSELLPQTPLVLQEVLKAAVVNCVCRLFLALHPRHIPLVISMFLFILALSLSAFTSWYSLKETNSSFECNYIESTTPSFPYKSFFSNYFYIMKGSIPQLNLTQIRYQ